jgi:CheY-like chemotaxis protein
MASRRREPVAELAPKRRARSSTYPITARPASVVVVEDYDGLRDAIADALRYAGWDVHTFVDPEEALTFIRCEVPTMVLTDFNTGALTGPALARELRLDPATRNIPIVGMSGSVHPTERMLSYFDLFLPKPLDLSELDGRLRSVLGG